MSLTQSDADAVMTALSGSTLPPVVSALAADLRPTTGSVLLIDESGRAQPVADARRPAGSTAGLVVVTAADPAPELLAKARAEIGDTGSVLTVWTGGAIADLWAGDPPPRATSLAALRTRVGRHAAVYGLFGDQVLLLERTLAKDAAGTVLAAWVADALATPDTAAPDPALLRTLAAAGLLLETASRWVVVDGGSGMAGYRASGSGIRRIEQHRGHPDLTVIGGSEPITLSGSASIEEQLHRHSAAGDVAAFGRLAAAIGQWCLGATAPPDPIGWHEVYGDPGNFTVVAGEADAVGDAAAVVQATEAPDAGGEPSSPTVAAARAGRLGHGHGLLIAGWGDFARRNLGSTAVRRLWPADRPDVSHVRSWLVMSGLGDEAADLDAAAFEALQTAPLAATPGDESSGPPGVADETDGAATDEVVDRLRARIDEQADRLETLRHQLALRETRIRGIRREWTAARERADIAESTLRRATNSTAWRVVRFGHYVASIRNPSEFLATTATAARRGVKYARKRIGRA